ncbi:hypothetical protein AGR4A_Cc190323 [Agrobacterium tumefaciens str. B6]|uniref:Uncharacterized protein n=2 Tax=Agrobacterium tumefaciens TaxID=358 RepID=A0A822UZU7_AGRTU|nr:hypothetical protein AGR4C_Cc120135 [Agrobacterium tumefaciens str. Kerr 14]CVI15801.1 hypothetical protein AGR4A_Cc190323 [Agrobacterium tumefaciens str. B6]
MTAEYATEAWEGVRAILQPFCTILQKYAGVLFARAGRLSR